MSSFYTRLGKYSGDESRERISKSAFQTDKRCHVAIGNLSRSNGVPSNPIPKGEPDAQPNILMIITDQERAIQHFPPQWERKNLSNITLLKQNGLSFKNAVCNACMCSPSRSTLFTSLYPAQHGVNGYPDFWQPLFLGRNRTEQHAPHDGYDVTGYPQCPIWHMCKGSQNSVHPEKSLMAAEVAVFGFGGWTPPDVGEETKLENFGGGYANHDDNYIKQAITFIEEHKKAQAQAAAAGKPRSNLSFWSFRWTAQAQLLQLLAVGLGPLVTRKQKRH